MFARLIPFVFNSRDSLVLVFKDGVVNFIKNGAPVLLAGTPYGIPTPYTEADLQRLGYVQAGNVVTLVHPKYPVYELTRIADDNWTLTLATFGAAILPPASFVGFTVGTGIDTDLSGWLYVITAIGADGEESLVSGDASYNATPKVVLTLEWAPSVGAQSYRIYRRPPRHTLADVGAPGLIGVSVSPLFTDYGRDPDFLQQPPIARVVFNSAGNYPSAVGYWQQRRVFANTNTNPDMVWASQVGRPNNFNISVPVKDDDAVNFRLVSDTVDEIRHILAQGQLTLLTEGGEWPVLGDSNGVLTPIVINPRKVSSHGVGVVRPIPATGSLLFPQALGSTILGLEGTAARDLTLFSTHLFDGHQIVDMAWQQETPHVAWFVRDDGVMLGLTYIPDQDVIAWHRHDFLDGFAESVCTVPELVGNRIEHAVYITVGRASGASLKHTIERLASPFSSNVEEEAWFVDGGVEYDGRFTSLPSNAVSGLDHLEGRGVAVYAFGKMVAGNSDGLGHVVANPLRPELAVLTVSAGTVILPDSYLRIVVGMPFISDLETLDVESAEGPSLKTQKTNIGRVGLQVIDSRNIWAGGSLPGDATPTQDMDPLALSTDSDFNDLVTDFLSINTRGQWSTNGRMALRSIDPTPFTVLSAVPQGYFPNPQEG